MDIMKNMQIIGAKFPEMPIVVTAHMAARMETVNAVTGATEIVIWYNEKWKIAAVSTVAGQCSVNEMVFDSDNLPSESRTSSGMAYPATSDKPAFAVCGAGVHAEYFRI